MASLTGLTLSGYLVTGELGSGAASYIYKVQDPVSGQTLALKRVMRRNKNDDRFIEQTETEWENAKQVNDARVRQVKALKKIRKFFSVSEVHLIMEYCSGHCLDKVRPRDIPDIMYIFRETAEGVAAIHRAGLVHADLKPNNIMIDHHGHLKIIDMGQSCPIGMAKLRIQGTPDYIAPEQVQRRPLDERTDIFNLGATFYWVLTQRAFPTLITPERARVALVSQRAAVPPHEIRPDVHTALSKLVLDCCETSPDERPSSIHQVLQRLSMVEAVMRRNNMNMETSFSKTGKMDIAKITEESEEEIVLTESRDADSQELQQAAGPTKNNPQAGPAPQERRKEKPKAEPRREPDGPQAADHLR